MGSHHIHSRQKPAWGTGEHVRCIDERCEVAEQMARFGGTARQGPNTGLCHTLGCVRFPITVCEIVILSFRSVIQVNFDVKMHVAPWQSALFTSEEKWLTSLIGQLSGSI
jgi:hypothetical protein